MKDGLVYRKTIDMFYGNTVVRYGYHKDELHPAIEIPNIYHRDDGPARISIDEYGVIIQEQWFVNGVSHRLVGPAMVNYFEDGSNAIKICSYYIFGREISKEDYNTPGFIDSFILEHS